jgi:hypothetical protein
MSQVDMKQLYIELQRLETILKEIELLEQKVMPILLLTIREENYIGEVVYVIPKVGLLTQALRPLL